MSQGKFLAVALLAGADKGRYNQLQVEIENVFKKGDTKAYPETITDTLHLMTNYNPDTQKRHKE